jgi:hypothetical protein
MLPSLHAVHNEDSEIEDGSCVVISLPLDEDALVKWSSGRPKRYPPPARNTGQGRILRGLLSPGRLYSPPQDREDRQKRPPERVGRLVRDNGEHDADDDADQRCNVSCPHGHVVSLPWQPLQGFMFLQDTHPADKAKGTMTIKLGRTTIPLDVARDRHLTVWVLMAVVVGLGFLPKLHT